ncbi:MAG: metallophosphoesterase [Victivallales bacterium]|nr:metallophosphoesterase [Victivallales bacterium]
MKALWRCLICLVVGCLVGGRMAMAQDAAAPSFDALGIDEATAKEIGLVFENVEIEVEGLKRDYLFLWIADLYVITDDLSEVAPDDLETVKTRRDKAFRNSQTKLSSLEVWQRLIPVLNRSNADAVLLGGDICDFGSLSNIQAIKDGLAQLRKPYLYARADHDISPWWLAERKPDEVAALEQSIDGNEPVQVLEAEDLMVVSFNVSTSNLSVEGLKRFKAAYAKGKPILLITHVPFNSLVDPNLGETSMARDGQKRNLTWGQGCYYSPNATTQEFLDMVLAEDSPVFAVLAGHLHFPWHGRLTERISQHLFAPAYCGNIGVISLKCKAN